MYNTPGEGGIIFQEREVQYSRRSRYNTPGGECIILQEEEDSKKLIYLNCSARRKTIERTLNSELKKIFERERGGDGEERKRENGQGKCINLLYFT
jgi:hypothetical protein